MIEAKRFRDRHLNRMKKQAEKQKDLQEKIEKRAKATIQQDDPFQGFCNEKVTYIFTNARMRDNYPMLNRVSLQFYWEEDLNVANSM